MTKRTNFILFLALFLPLFLQAQMQKGLFTMRPALSINKGEERTDYGIGMNYGKMLNDDILVSGGIGGGTGSGKKSAYIGSFGANVGIQYFYLNDSKWNPYLSANVAYSVTRLRLQFVNTLPGSIVKDTVFNYNINQVDASVGTGVQYFLNENLAVKANFLFTNFGVGSKTSKPLLQQEYRISLQPFYSLKSSKEAKDIKDFFYRGRTSVNGEILFAPKKIGIANDYNIFVFSAGAKYFLHKYLGIGGGLGIYNISKTLSISASLNTETNIKLLKRLYFSPSLGVFYSHGKLNGDKTNVSANLGFSYFINKNIAWNLGFLSVPIYNKETTKPKILYLNNSFSYYLK